MIRKYIRNVAYLHICILRQLLLIIIPYISENLEDIYIDLYISTILSYAYILLYRFSILIQEYHPYFYQPFTSAFIQQAEADYEMWHKEKGEGSKILFD